MIAVVEAAIDPLARIDPTSLTSTQSRELRKLKELLPPIQREFFQEFCENQKRAMDLRSFLAYLNKKFDARRAETGGLSRAKKLERRQEVEKTKKPNKTEEKRTLLAQTVYSSMDTEGDGQPVLVTRELKCPLCEGEHSLGYCPKFKEQTLPQRRETVRALKVCLCCLKVGHMIRSCRSKKHCSADGCKSKHHRLLHDEEFQKVLYFERGGDDTPCSSDQD